jgi:hypothetical protein
MLAPADLICPHDRAPHRTCGHILYDLGQTADHSQALSVALTSDRTSAFMRPMRVVGVTPTTGVIQVVLADLLLQLDQMPAYIRTASAAAASDSGRPARLAHHGHVPAQEQYVH